MLEEITVSYKQVHGTERVCGLVVGGKSYEWPYTVRPGSVALFKFTSIFATMFVIDERSSSLGYLSSYTLHPLICRRHPCVSRTTEPVTFEVVVWLRTH